MANSKNSKKTSGKSGVQKSRSGRSGDRSTCNGLPVEWKLAYGLPPSGIQTFIDDRETFRCRYKLGLDSKHWGGPLIFGGACHHCIDRFNMEEIKDGSDPKQNLGHCKRWVSDFEQTMKKDGNSSKDPQEQERLLGMAEVTMAHYFSFYNADLESRERIASESKFRFEYKGYSFVGTRDAIDDFGEGGIWIQDTKSGSVSDLSDEAYAHSIQFRLYMLSFLIEYGYMPDGIVLDSIKRSQSKIGKQDDNSLVNYLNRLYKDIGNRPEFYFSRKDISIDENSLIDWADNTLIPIMKEIEMWEDGKIPHYMNPSALIKYNQRSQFWDFLISGSKVGLRVSPYWHKYANKELIDACNG